MSDFTNEQPEALKEGATPGPWEWYEDQGIISLRGPGREPIATDLNARDADVLASSRTRLDDLIEEKRAHRKLRDEMGELINYLSIQEGNDNLSRAYVQGQHSAMELIKDILEATDE